MRIRSLAIWHRQKSIFTRKNYLFMNFCVYPKKKIECNLLEVSQLDFYISFWQVLRFSISFHLPSSSFFSCLKIDSQTSLHLTTTTTSSAVATWMIWMGDDEKKIFKFSSAFSIIFFLANILYFSFYAVVLSYRQILYLILQGKDNRFWEFGTGEGFILENRLKRRFWNWSLPFECNDIMMAIKPKLKLQLCSMKHFFVIKTFRNIAKSITIH